jgi:hypothetical protein
LLRSREIDGLKLAIFGETADREVRGRGAIDDRHNRAASFAALAGPSIHAVSRSTRSPRRTSTSALSNTFSASGAAYRKRGKSLRSIGPGMAVSWWSASRASQPTGMAPRLSRDQRIRAHVGRLGNPPRQAVPTHHARAQVGIALATAVMYLRILAMIAVFNWSLAASLTPSLLALSLLGFAFAGLHGWCAGRPAAQTSVRESAARV